MIGNKIPFSTVVPMHNEIRAELDSVCKRVLDNAWFIQGKECDAFEKEYAEYIGTDYCVGSDCAVKYIYCDSIGSFLCRGNTCVCRAGDQYI